jgi:hypothetical protein
MRLTISGFTALCLVVLTSRSPGQSEPPKKIASPDGKYTVEMVEEAMPGADDLEDFTLILSSNGKALAKMPTYGYLMAAHWSSDGKFVAVNNRRGNSGDYLWVFDLQTGKALKKPDDKLGEDLEKKAGQEVHKELPSANEDTLVRDWVTAQGWDGNQLKVIVRSLYRGAKGAFDLELLIDPANWQIKSSKLVRQGAEED